MTKADIRPDTATPRPGKRARTRQKLIAAATEVISEKGLDKTSLEEIAGRAAMTRGAVYGNFKDKYEIFQAVMEAHWKPIIPAFKVGAGLKEQMGILGRTVAKEATARRKLAAAATSFQLYVVTHAGMRRKLTEKNAAIYKWLASEFVKVVPEHKLPMPAETFICVLDAITTGLMFSYFQTPDLITEDIFIAAFEALA